MKTVTIGGISREYTNKEIKHIICACATMCDEGYDKIDIEKPLRIGQSLFLINRMKSYRHLLAEMVSQRIVSKRQYTVCDYALWKLGQHHHDALSASPQLRNR